MSLLDRIRTQADKMGLTIAEVEKRTGLSKKSIYRWDSSEPSISKVVAVANLLQVSVVWIATGKEDEYSIPDEHERDLLNAFRCLSPEAKSEILDYIKFKLDTKSGSLPCLSAEEGEDKKGSIA